MRTSTYRVSVILVVLLLADLPACFALPSEAPEATSSSWVRLVCSFVDDHEHVHFCDLDQGGDASTVFRAKLTDHQATISASDFVTAYTLCQAASRVMAPSLGGYDLVDIKAQLVTPGERRAGRDAILLELLVDRSVTDHNAIAYNAIDNNLATLELPSLAASSSDDAEDDGGEYATSLEDSLMLASFSDQAPDSSPDSSKGEGKSTPTKLKHALAAPIALDAPRPCMLPTELALKHWVAMLGSNLTRSSSLPHLRCGSKSPIAANAPSTAATLRRRELDELSDSDHRTIA